jgi:hypothetical protein
MGKSFSTHNPFNAKGIHGLKPALILHNQKLEQHLKSNREAFSPFSREGKAGGVNGSPVAVTTQR